MRLDDVFLRGASSSFLVFVRFDSAGIEDSSARFLLSDAIERLSDDV